jgi:hypothetical protein
MSKRNLTALNKLYQRPPTNEHIERDFHKRFYDAWREVTCLYDYLEACHQDGLLIGISASAERLLKELAQVRDSLDQDTGCWDLDLDLPAGAPTAAVA